MLDWLNAAMDLHYCDGPNPAWDDGKALEEMWKKTLEGELPEDDRHENPVPEVAQREQYSLHATYIAIIKPMSTCSFATLLPPSPANTMSITLPRLHGVPLPLPCPTQGTNLRSFSAHDGAHLFNRHSGRRGSDWEGATDTRSEKRRRVILPTPQPVPRPPRTPLRVASVSAVRKSTRKSNSKDK